MEIYVPVGNIDLIIINQRYCWCVCVVWLSQLSSVVSATTSQPKKHVCRFVHTTNIELKDGDNGCSILYAGPDSCFWVRCALGIAVVRSVVARHVGSPSGLRASYFAWLPGTILSSIVFHLSWCARSSALIIQGCQSSIVVQLLAAEDSGSQCSAPLFLE